MFCLNNNLVTITAATYDVRLEAVSRFAAEGAAPSLSNIDLPRSMLCRGLSLPCSAFA